MMMTEKTTDQKELYAQISELQIKVARTAESMVKTAQAAEFLINAFNALDEWRHFPAYQLERRVDVFFALLLPQIVEVEFGLVADKVEVIPEFPLRKGTLNNGYKDDNQSTKVDFAVFGYHRNGGNRLILIELKTDNKSVDYCQLMRMKIAKEKGIEALLKGVVQCGCHSEQKGKYAHLVGKLNKVGCISIPEGLKRMEITDTSGLKREFYELKKNFDHHICKRWSDSEISKVELALIYPGGELELQSRKDEKTPTHMISCLRLVNFEKVVNIVGESPISPFLDAWAASEAGRANPWAPNGQCSR